MTEMKMKTLLFTYRNGYLTEIQQKLFCFEHAMEGYIADNPNILENEFVGLSKPEIKELEWSLKDGKRIDVLARYDNDTIAIVELKNVLVTTKALKQLNDYISLVKEMDEYKETPLIGILVGPSFEEEVLDEIGKNKNLYGVELLRYFDEDKWYIFTKWHYNQNKGHRDYTKYKLNDCDSLYGKGKLAYAIVETYIKEHPEVSFETLKEVFPNNIVNRGSISTIAIESEVKEEDRFARYFKDPIKCNGYEIIVCSQWDSRNIDNLLNKAKGLKYSVTY
jgi:hypothetical protein